MTKEMEELKKSQDETTKNIHSIQRLYDKRLKELQDIRQKVNEDLGQIEKRALSAMNAWMSNLTDTIKIDAQRQHAELNQSDSSKDISEDEIIEYGVRYLLRKLFKLFGI
ncbi:hypothetical protein DPMN_066151 [Dreissena polymorpha]|uniref:Uncharacterized protein n=1 Tax=Dreissena polymorpha TaxID=45954 RepID=A0A9D3YUW9_DREPO|nr:hypothetical protein DPMN_066151 [Dreissena polymorpha]